MTRHKSKNNSKNRQRKNNSRRQRGGNSLHTPVGSLKSMTGPDSSVPSPLKNGGWFTGPQATGSWRNVYVPPTTSGAIKNLASANPPPGAMEQYPGTLRLGNNYFATPDLKNYETTLPTNQGPFAMNCTGGRRRVKRGRNNKNKNNNNNKNRNNKNRNNNNNQNRNNSQKNKRNSRKMSLKNRRNR